MYKFDEQSLKKGIRIGLGSQGIWTPELENVMFDEITNEALRIHDVVGQCEQLPLDFVKWYSGMEQEKILKSYERWVKESGNLH